MKLFFDRASKEVVAKNIRFSPYIKFPSIESLLSVMFIFKNIQFIFKKYSLCFIFNFSTLFICLLENEEVNPILINTPRHTQTKTKIKLIN